MRLFRTPTAADEAAKAAKKAAAQAYLDEINARNQAMTLAVITRREVEAAEKVRASADKVRAKADKSRRTLLSTPTQRVFSHTGEREAIDSAVRLDLETAVADGWSVVSVQGSTPALQGLITAYDTITVILSR